MTTPSPHAPKIGAALSLVDLRIRAEFTARVVTLAPLPVVIGHSRTSQVEAVHH